MDTMQPPDFGPDVGPDFATDLATDFATDVGTADPANLRPEHLRAEFIARSTDRLDILAAFAMNVARLLHDVADRLAIAAPVAAAERLPPLTRAFDSTARTIRQTIALERRLHQDATRPDPAPTAARRPIARRPENALETVEPVERENLLRDLHECLHDPDLDLDLDSNSVDEIIEDIKRNLGRARQAAKPGFSAPACPNEARADIGDNRPPLIWSHGTVPT